MLIKETLKTEVITLLKNLIQTPSFSREETQSAALIEAFFQAQDLNYSRANNNLWARSKYWDANKPTVLFNSHHDTVKPAASWTFDPFKPTLKSGRLYGLGSNDAGASLMALLATFLQFHERTSLPFNLIFAATAEEEISGSNGIASILPQLGKIDLGIIGEPTQMQMAIAEKGLMVIDALTHGQAGHAARDEGENAILKAMTAIEKIQNHQFSQTSKWLGNVKCSVTQIHAGTQHNVVPDQCHFVIDVRTTDAYSNEAVFDILQNLTDAQLTARSFRLQASGLSETHPIIQAGKSMGLTYFGSPTLSDQALLPFPTLKIGPGDSARSHTADEYIELSEIEEAISIYTQLINTLAL